MKKKTLENRAMKTKNNASLRKKKALALFFACRSIYTMGLALP